MVGYRQTNQKTDTGKTLTRWPVFVDHFIMVHYKRWIYNATNVIWAEKNMNSVQIEENVKSLVKQVSSQEISKDDFVYELLLAYGHRKSVVSRVKSGERT